MYSRRASPSPNRRRTQIFTGSRSCARVLARLAWLNTSDASLSNEAVHRRKGRSRNSNKVKYTYFEAEVEYRKDRKKQGKKIIHLSNY